MDLFRHFVNRIAGLLSNLGAWFSVFCLFVLTAMICIGTLSRYLLNKPILGVDEISGYFNILIGFLALSYAFERERHVRADILTRKLPDKIQTILEIAGCCLAFLLIVQFLRTGWYTFMILAQSGERAQTYLRTPLAVPYGFLLIGWVFLLLSVIARLFRKKNLSEG